MSVSIHCRASRLVATTVGTLWFIAASAPAHAQVSLYQISRNASYTQNSTAVPTTADSYQFSVSADLTTPNAFDSASIAFTGAYATHPFPLTPSSTFFSGLVFEASLAALNSDFALGDYTLTAHDSTNTNPDGVYTINYAADAYTSVPGVSAATYTGLQGVDPTQDFTLNFAPFVISPNADANSGSIAINIYDASSTSALFTFLPPTATSLLVPANTLDPSTPYTLFMNYSDGIGAPSNGASTVQSFQSTTTIAFTSGVPEPTCFALLLVSGPCATLRRRRSGGPTLSPR